MKKYKPQDTIRIVTRTSNLALKQVDEFLSYIPGIKTELIPIVSFGDRHKEVSLLNNNIQDFFTRELDEALLNNEADLAVHSAKDLPYPLPEGLELIALTRAFDQTDSIVSRDGFKLEELPANPRLGTSSLLRKAELLKMRPDVQIVSIRGTIEERIRQVDDGEIDAAIVATCALKRLHLEHRISEILPFETHPLQGHLAILARKDDKQIRKIIDAIPELNIRKEYGKIWLVGFGPGNPDLLTIQGLKVIRKCDVILYDDLLDKTFLNRFKAEKIYVGKRKDHHSYEQEEINKLMYRLAVSGKNIVRLKGGDPMIFGHGGEEVEFLKRYLIDVEVIPGITTALAAAALTGIPLTHRDISSSVTLMTGHSAENLEVPSSGTLVYYMGASNLRIIAEKSIMKGWDPSTPVLLIHQVSGKDQEEIFTTLKDAAENKVRYKTPLLIIIGNVVALKHNASENIAKPTILVTGTQPDMYKPFGKVIYHPVIRIQPLKDYSCLHEFFGRLSGFQWLLFTSRYTVQYFFSELKNQGKDARILAGLRIASIGKTTTEALRREGIIPDLQPQDESSEGLLTLFQSENITGQAILLPRSNLGLPVLPEGLQKLGNKVTTVVVYENVPQTGSTIKDTVDYVAFSSPSCVENYFNAYSDTFPKKAYIVQGNETLKALKRYLVWEKIVLLNEFRRMDTAI